ncbi:small ribosomal subunit protein uS3m isoform X1 [Rhinolophus sinicus]|uniref:small ribosomal subunit protein uS3m isoform X1 n=1 Tax=Rhinolophus sinicus TaxID=89399 RepID=UPI003D7AF148
MAAPMCRRGLGPRVLSWSRQLPCTWSALHTSAVRAKNRAARVRVGKGDKPVTYEEAHAPHHIAHRKGWLSLHTEGAGGLIPGLWDDQCFYKAVRREWERSRLHFVLVKTSFFPTVIWMGRTTPQSERWRMFFSASSCWAPSQAAWLSSLS